MKLMDAKDGPQEILRFALRQICLIYMMQCTCRVDMKASFVTVQNKVRVCRVCPRTHCRCDTLPRQLKALQQHARNTRFAVPLPQ
jgi:hypothetical protein